MSNSELLNNTARGFPAESLLAATLGLYKGPRTGWDEYDLLMKSGTKIKVKSSAYVQSWKQTKTSVVRFGIVPHKSRDTETGKYTKSFLKY